MVLGPLLAASWLVGGARAEPACAPGNLLAGREPQVYSGAFHPERLTDGRVGGPEMPHDGALATNFQGRRPFVSWDLGGTQTVRWVDLAGVPAPGWQVDLSDDGSRWLPALVSPPAPASIRHAHLRVAVDPPVEARFVRLSPGAGDGAIGASELFLACTPEEPPRTVSALAPANPDTLTLVRRSSTQKAVLGGLVAVLFAVGGARPRLALALVGVVAGLAVAWTLHGAAMAAGLVSVGALLLVVARDLGGQGARARAALLVVAALAAFTNFGRFHGTWSVHWHDASHYWLGARFAPELGYDGIYDCVSLADQEGGNWEVPPERPLRDLRTHALVPTSSLAASPPACRARFTPERWEALRRDVAFLSSQFPPGAWDHWFVDFGYNPSPVWTGAFRLAGLGDAPASFTRLEGLLWVDVAFLVGILLVGAWGFGAEAGVLAAWVLALGFPWIWLWTGGGIGRFGWLFVFTGAVALAQRGRMAGAGALAGVAAGLLGFPGVITTGSLVGILTAAAARRRPATGDLAFLVAFVGVLGALVAVTGASLGWSVWGEFLDNSRRHMGVESFNRIGVGLVGRQWLGTGGLVLTLLAQGTALVAVGRALWIEPDPGRRVGIAALLPLVVFGVSSYYGALTLTWAPLLLLRPGLAPAVLLGLVGGLVAPMMDPGDRSTTYFSLFSAGIWLVVLLAARAAAAGRRE